MGAPVDSRELLERVPEGFRGSPWYDYSGTHVNLDGPDADEDVPFVTAGGFEDDAEQAATLRLISLAPDLVAALRAEVERREKVEASRLETFMLAQGVENNLRRDLNEARRALAAAEQRGAEREREAATAYLRRRAAQYDEQHDTAGWMVLNLFNDAIRSVELGVHVDRATHHQPEGQG